MQHPLFLLELGMARIDSLLSIVVAQGANELRLGADREPRMLASGVPKRLSLPATPEQTLRELLDGLLDEARETTMRSNGRVEFSYDAPTLGAFHVTAARRTGGGFDVVFLRGPTSRAEAPSSAMAAPRALRLAADASPSAPVQVGSEESQTLAQLVAVAVAMRASDLHVSDGGEPMVRVDGALRPLGGGPVDVGSLLRLTASQHEQVAEGRSLDIGMDIEGAGRVRVHVFRTSVGTSIAVRLLPEAAPALGSLHLPIALDDLVEFPHGLVLVGGASGSGKSTTLAALAQEALRRRSIVLTTLEDPIEYTLSSPGTSVVRRRQVGRDVPDFATGLRDALREDPDVLLLGEMRDPETINLALTAAETGHLVLSSIHCRSAASAIERIVDASGSREAQIRGQLAESLRAVVVQRLLRRAHGRGRVPVVEVLRGTHAVGALIREGKAAQIATALQSGKRDGMLPLERCLADRVNAGEIALEDARSAANDAASLEMYLAK
jgi:twitching motility protein PilT